MIDKLLSFVAPHHCSGCQKVGGLLCIDCKNDIIGVDVEGCIVCEAAAKDGVCPVHAGSYQKAWWVGERAGALQRLIGIYKFQHGRTAFKALAELLDARLPSFPRGALLVPVPTAAAHIRERGYDQVLLVTKHFARLRGLKVAKVIERVGKTTQRHASRADRFKQASAAFRLSGGVDPDATYLVVDDVVTTGATLKAVARLLSESGARKVRGVLLARQSPKRAQLDR